MIKTAAINPSMTHLRIAEHEPTSDCALANRTVVEDGREFCPVADTLNQMFSGRCRGSVRQHEARRKQEMKQFAKGILEVFTKEQPHARQSPRVWDQDR